MGGKSKRTERNHREILFAYNCVVKKYKALSDNVPKGECYKIVAKQLGYAPITVRKAVNALTTKS